LRIKIIIFLLSLSFLSIGIYRYVAVDKHVEDQVEVICTWLNSGSDSELPKVGPLAHKKLKYLKSKYSNNFKCKVEEPTISQSRYAEKAIVVYHNKVNKLGLLYQFGGGVKQAFKPHYFHLWTPSDSGEDPDNNY